MTDEEAVKIVYVVTVINSNSKFPSINRRNVGIFSDFYEALDIIENNSCDINESCYDFALIEFIPMNSVYFVWPPKIFKQIQKKHWFVWDKKKQKYISCIEPAFSKNINNWLS